MSDFDLINICMIEIRSIRLTDCEKLGNKYFNTSLILLVTHNSLLVMLYVVRQTVSDKSVFYYL